MNGKNGKEHKKPFIGLQKKKIYLCYIFAGKIVCDITVLLAFGVIHLE